jgi:hypothetical protein
MSSGGAGANDLKLGKISYQFVPTPDDLRGFFRGPTLAASALNAKWLQVEVQFGSDPDWVDELQVKYYVLLGKGQDARVFSGQMTHVNVARGSYHYSAMFMQPNTVQEYGHGQVEAVAAQIFYKNQLVGQDSVPPSRVDWWEKSTPTTGFLLSPQQTPWLVIANERYEAVKVTP